MVERYIYSSQLYKGMQGVGVQFLASLIFSFSMRWKFMVNFTPWALYPQGKNRSILTTWVAVCTPEPFRTSVEEQISCPRWDRTQDPSIHTIVVYTNYRRMMRE
jgi:hypothetical protein